MQNVYKIGSDTEHKNKRIVTKVVSSNIKIISSLLNKIKCPTRKLQYRFLSSVFKRGQKESLQNITSLSIKFDST